MIPYAQLFESCNRKLNSVLAIIKSQRKVVSVATFINHSDILLRRLCPLYLATSSFLFKHKEHLGVKVIRLVLSKYFSYDIWAVVVVFNTP